MREDAWHALTHPDDIPHLTEVWGEMLSGRRRQYRCDWRLRGSDGRWHWVRSVARTTESDGEGRALRIAGIYFDIGPFKAAEAARDEIEADLASVIEGSPHPLFIVDERCRILRWNRSANELAVRLSGRSVLTGDDVTKLSPVRDPAAARSYVVRALGGESVSVEREVTDAGGSMWLDVSARPLPAAASGAPRVVITAVDVTERHQIQAARAQMLKLESLGLLAGGVAHDFNNLLTAIIGNVELAIDSGEIDTATVEGLDDALVAARRAAEVAGWLLEYAGQRPAKATRIDCGAVARETVRLLRKSLPNTVQVREDLACPAPLAFADRTQFQQMLINLIVNARDAVTEFGGEIVVQTRAVTLTPELRKHALVATHSPSDSYVSVVVEDDGPGMDRATLDRIFEPFFTTKPGGHGLGLASVIGAVRANNALLFVDSAPGRGTRFEVLFPTELAPA